MFKNLSRRGPIAISKAWVYRIWVEAWFRGRYEIVPGRGGQTIEWDFMYASDRLWVRSRRSSISYFCGTSDDGKEKIWIARLPQMNGLKHWFRTPLSTEINPIQPFTTLLVNLTKFDMSIWSWCRNSTMAFACPSPARKTSALLGRPSLSSWELVTRYNERGLFAR
jgi:hypothetical protein